MRILFGALAAPLWQQVKLPPQKLRDIQRMADSITLLAIHGALSEAEAHRARKRIVKKIAALLT